MIEIQWAYLQNPFDNVTKRNFKKMFLLATDHFDKLKQQAPGNPQIQALLDFGQENFDAYIEQYRKGSTDSATYRMKTATFENMIAELSGTLIRRWDVTIQVLYDVVDPIYKALLPNGRKPFQSGSYDLRIDQVFSLADRLKEFPDLRELEETIRTFGDRLIESRTAQQGVDGVEKTNSDDLEMKRQALAHTMHGIFGSLVRLYYDNPARVESFYDLQYLRSNGSRTEDDITPREAITIMLPPTEKTTLLAGKVLTNDTIRITNTGSTSFSAYMTLDPLATPTNMILVEPGQMLTFTAAAVNEILVLWNESSMEGEGFVELF